MDIGDNELHENDCAQRSVRSPLTSCLKSELLVNILSYLWFDDHAVISLVCIALHNVTQSESLATFMLQKLLEYLNQPLRSSRISFNAEVRLVLRRVSSWPSAVDVAALNHSQGPRNVSLVLDNILGNDSCVVYREKRKQNRSKAYAVAISDDHFPCLYSTANYRFKNETNQGWIRPVRDVNSINKVELQNIIIRSITPFTKIVQISETEQVVTLSCVGYFESHVQPKSAAFITDNSISDDNDSHQLYQLQLSIGLACALFPLRGRRVGFDKNSFGYHGDGRIFHGGRNCIKVGPSYDIGDTVGCGVLFPPLGKQNGQIFYTKNGFLAALLDIGAAGLLSLPWFPIVGLAPSIPVEFNFGISRPFIFDVIAFEEQQLLEANFPSSSGANRESNSSSNSSNNNNNNNNNSSSSSSSSSSSNNNNNNNSNSNNNNNSNSSSSSSSSSNSGTYNQYRSGDSKNASSPGGRGCYSDPWRYYEHQVEEQEAKQRVTRHPKYKNCRWDSSNRTSETAMPAGLGQGQGLRVPAYLSSSPVGLSIGAGIGVGAEAGAAVDRSGEMDATHGLRSAVSAASSSSSSAVRYSVVSHAASEQNSSGMSVSQDGNEGFEEMLDSTPHDVSSMHCAARTGRGGRGGHFLSAKRQYTYISRSAKLERLTTIISAANGPYGSHLPHPSSSRKSPLIASASSSSMITNTGKRVPQDAQDDKRKVPYNRDKCFAEKVKKKRKSLFLNPHLRAATLSEISSTCRPALGGSDASCEDEDEEDSDEEEDDEEELASTCGQDADSHDEWGFRGFRANRPLLPPRVMIRAPTSYSIESREHEHQQDDDDDLGSMAVEPSSEDEDEERNINVTFTAIPRPSSSPLAMRPPSLPEGSRDRKPMGMNYRTYSNFASSSYQPQGVASTHIRRDCSAMNMTDEGDGMASVDTGVGAFVALADVAHGSGPNWLLKGFGGNPTVGFGGRADVDRDSDESVATSLFVEVASVDECGSYIGYGGAGDSEEEDDEVGSERGSRNGMLSGHPVGWGTEAADADGDLESLSVEDKFGAVGGRKRKVLPSASRDFNTFHSDSSNNLRVMWDPDGDGYDGASERGRCETDGFEDFNTDGDVEFEEIEGTEDRFSNSSGSGYDGSVDADGCASDTYATERNTVLRCTLLTNASAPRKRAMSPSVHSLDSSVSGSRIGAERHAAPNPAQQHGQSGPSQEHPHANSGSSRRLKRRKMRHQLSRRDSGSKENTDDQRAPR